VAPVLGMIATMLGMAEAFSVLKTSGAGDPAKLSAAIGDVLIYTIIAVSLALIGLVLVTLAITACRYRARWMLKFLRFYDMLTLVLSVGLLVFGQFKINLYLPFGLFFLIFAQMKKEEFIQSVPAKRKLPSCYKLDD
jgi:ABC-type tungstate transport system substrate-binding protein